MMYTLTYAIVTAVSEKLIKNNYFKLKAIE